jgi:DNA (cytosine-5)-methyltransferase 1
VLVENVAALLNRGMGRVLGDLAAGGYDAEWSVLSACALGASHARERVFIYAHREAKRTIQSTEGIQEERLSRESGRMARGEGLLRMDQPPVVGSRNGIPDYFHRNGSLGNAVVPQVAEWIGRRIIEAAI